MSCTAFLQAEQEIRPFVDLIVRVRLLERPSYILTKEGLEKVSDGLDESQRAIIKQCEQHIAAIWAKAAWIAGVTQNPTPYLHPGP